ncbi:hypothetical protein PsYK624_079600 [Phanerochaete sordida]|uniref:Uncharacterized protein n=1 Tax=Phanerochaete sordida TaxID=48140 RepID=A0A9P3LEP0_9APHY|nr:hypothetical protein PsYK624_079600 [Phanerochaete sordida]
MAHRAVLWGPAAEKPRVHLSTSPSPRLAASAGACSLERKAPRQGTRGRRAPRERCLRGVPGGRRNAVLPRAHTSRMQDRGGLRRLPRSLSRRLRWRCRVRGLLVGPAGRVLAGRLVENRLAENWLVERRERTTGECGRLLRRSRSRRIFGRVDSRGLRDPCVAAPGAFRGESARSRSET